ncbi:MAG: acyltransferase [Wenzhouxiangella sp.]
MNRLRHGVFIILELVIRYAVVPTIRARLLWLFGAEIGNNVRIQECRFVNLDQGFRHLTIGDDVFIGADCLIDLKGPVRIGMGTSLSPRVALISHNDPGSAHQTPLLSRFAVDADGVSVGDYCWIGTGTTVLSGSKIGHQTVIGAMSLVRGAIPSRCVFAGTPARKIKSSDQV